MSIDRIIASIPEKSEADRDKMRENAKRLSETGTAQQKTDAEKLLAALDRAAEAELKALYDRLKDLPAAARVVEAFRALPPSETDVKVVRALLDNPSSTSATLSAAIGWKGQAWHMHFGKMCFDREVYLWPAERSEKREASFYSGILAEFDPNGSLFTLKPDVVAAFAELGIATKEKP
ncbi:hypothetical protein roselon_00534 [Roseibacterium elongatum DSM 19469]|uniref:Uncharacterized protein n=1 Tax=Roseicyclus elongatus DSM 19469 TaxID=1294273 RepID=W8RPB0_9RHOB|nr:hypothetical protein [Roseibacterium elongatum]AHM02974.1 hypothetical protein roselon_00534 [Roseibacterium elongatum DSM 19469]